MTLTKSQIQLLQRNLIPPQRKFSLIEIIQKFPDNTCMHETFRQICLHYQSSCLSFSEIMQYLFGQFNRISTQANPNLCNKKTEIVRVQKKYGDQQFKVVLKGAKGTTQRIKQLLVIQDDYQYGQEMYAVTNTEVCQYGLKKQCFLDQVIKLQDNVIIKAAIYGNVICYITKLNQLYLQVLPRKLAQSNSPRKVNSKEHKTQINRILLTKLSESLPLLHLFALSQHQFLLIYSQYIVILSIPNNTTIQPSKLTHKYFYLNHSTTPIHMQTITTYTNNHSSSKQKQPSIISSFLMCHPFIALITDDSSILIINLDKMKISNMMINDNNFTSGCYNMSQDILVCGDYGGYVMSLSFNKYFGDIQQQGIGIRKKANQQNIKQQQTQKFSTFYINPNKKQSTKNQLEDQILSKQRQTAMTVVVQNHHRNPITLMSTKKSSLFTYQSKFHNVIKIWNIRTLKVIQKVQLNMEIYDMKISTYGLYLLSRQKGYLCYYATQNTNSQNALKNQSQIQLTDICISSNIMYINAINISQSVIYKLKLSNKPTLTQYLHKNAKNVQKSLKYSFYKNQVFLFNCSKTHSPMLQIYGIFGQNKQMIKQLKQYHSMIRYNKKQGVILWSNNKIFICCKQGANKVIHKTYEKGQYVFTTQSKQTYQKSSQNQKQLRSTQTITLSQQISKVKSCQNYLTIICQPDRSKNSKKSNSYIYDENSMCLSIVFQQLDQKYRIVQCHKFCSIIMKYGKNGNNLANSGNINDIGFRRQYFLFEHKTGRKLWQMDYIEGWIFQTVNIVNVTEQFVQILCVYKSNLLSNLQKSSKPKNSQKSNQSQKPLYYLIKTKIKIICQQKTFINLSKHSASKVYSQSQTFQQIVQRSIFQKITSSQIDCATLTDQTISKTIYKLFAPSINFLPGSKIKKNINFDTKSMEGKVLYYEKQQDVLMFSVTMQKVLIIYEMSVDIVGEVIGVLDFQNSDNVTQTNNKQFIAYWNQQYKKQDEQLWQQTKNRAINRAHNKNPSPLLIRSDSLRNTNRKWNPQNVQQHIIIPPDLPEISRAKSHKNISQKSDPQRLNQMFHKHNIYQSIIKQTLQNAKRNMGSTNRVKKQKKHKIIQNVDQQQIKALTTAVRVTKQTFYNQKKGIISTASKQTISSKLKTEQSIGSFGTMRTESKIRIKKPRYETQAIQQLQKSKIIQQHMLPKLSTRNQSVQFQKQKRNLIYDLLKKQNFSLKQSRNNQSRLEQNKQEQL